MPFLTHLWQDLNVQEKEKAIEILEIDLQGEILEVVEILKIMLRIKRIPEVGEVLKAVEGGEILAGGLTITEEIGVILR